MCLNWSMLKAVSLVLQNKVILEAVTPYYYFLEVDGVGVTYNSIKDVWLCTCIHESWRGSHTKQECYHIKAAKLFIKRKVEHDKNTD